MSAVNAFHALQPLYTLAGFAVGVLVGLTGVGGGSLMTPLLILVFGIHPAYAVGTDLLFAAATKCAGSLVHGVNRNIDWRIVGRLAAGSVPSTLFMLLVLRHLDINSTAAQDLITVVLAVVLFITAITLVCRRFIVERYAERLAKLGSHHVAVLTLATGFVLGIIVSISSVGAGAIGVTGLVLLYPKLPMARIVGSDIAHAVPLTLLAGFGHWLLGSTDLQIFGSLILGSVPGVLIGSYATVRVPETALRTILAGTLIVVATKLSFGLHHSPSLSSISTSGALGRHRAANGAPITIVESVRGRGRANSVVSEMTR